MVFSTIFSGVWGGPAVRVNYAPPLLANAVVRATLYLTYRQIQLIIRCMTWVVIMGVGALTVVGTF